MLKFNFLLRIYECNSVYYIPAINMIKTIIIIVLYNSDEQIKCYAIEVSAFYCCLKQLLLLLLLVESTTFQLGRITLRSIHFTNLIFGSWLHTSYTEFYYTFGYLVILWYPVLYGNNVAFKRKTIIIEWINDFGWF